MDDDLVRLIDEASEHLNENGRSNFEDIEYTEMLLALIIERVDFPYQKYHISQETFDRRVRNIIGQIEPDEDTETYFLNFIGDLKQNLQINGRDEYTIAFSLPIILHSEKEYHKFSIDGSLIEQISKNKWENEYIKKAQEDFSFKVDMTNSPHTLSSDGSFWKTTVVTADPQFAIERTEFILKTLLAEMNLAQHFGKVKHFETPSSNPWPRGWSDIRLPFCLLGFQDGDFLKAEFTEDIRPREIVDVEKEALSAIDEFPTFEEDYEIDDYLTSGFHFYLSGMTTPSNTESFLDFWRSLEILTLSEPNDTSGDIIDRSSILTSSNTGELFAKQLRRLVDVRNKLVHGKIDVNVSQSDINTLKRLSEYLLDLYISKRDHWNESDFKFVLHKCDPRKKQRLKQQRKAKRHNHSKIERELELLDELIRLSDK